jgi:hypothetical protein
VLPRKDHRGVDLISDSLPFGRLWYQDASAAVDYAKHSSRSHDAVTRVYDEAGNMIKTHEHEAVAPLGVHNPDRSPLGIHRRDTAPTPTAFLIIRAIIDGFPLTRCRCLILAANGLSFMFFA